MSQSEHPGSEVTEGAARTMSDPVSAACHRPLVDSGAGVVDYNYAEALRSQVSQDPSGTKPPRPGELGRTLMQDGLGLLDVVALHARALDRLEVEEATEVPRARADSFLREVLVPYEDARKLHRSSNDSLQTMVASLEEQVAERTRQMQQSLSELQSIDAERRRLLARVVDAQEAERRRLADDLHDDTIQVMVAANLRLGALRRWVNEGGEPALDRLEDTMVGAIRRLRRLIFELRPPALDREGIAEAIRIYVRETFDEGVDVVVDDRLDEQPPVEVREILYRIIQEALANVRKHAGATRIEVVLQARRSGFDVAVTDDGRGFDTRTLKVGRPGHLGVSAMRERAEMVGGWCRIDSGPGRGTEMTCWLPHATLS